MGGLVDRLLRRRRPPTAVDLVDDGSLVVVGTAFEAARADSAVLADMAAAGVDLDRPLLLRHHLRLPDEAAVAQAAALLAQDRYALSPRQEGGEPPGRGLAVVATRTQVLTTLSVAQERSRMAGLAQRLGGDADGWDALAPPEVAP